MKRSPVRWRMRVSRPLSVGVLVSFPVVSVSVSGLRLQRAGTTVVAVLHDLHLAFRYATHLVFMKDGQILAQGEPAQVVTPELVERVFAVPCRIIEDPETGAPLVIPRR